MEYFVGVAELGSFSRAAESLNVTQPGLSQQVQQLEREIGTQLIERLPRSVVLTEAGRAYLPHAKAVLRLSRQAQRSALNAVRGEAGDLEIATVTSIGGGIMPQAFSRWRPQYPDVRVRLHEYGRCDTLRREVEGGTGDIAIGPMPANWNGPVVSLGIEEFVVVLPPNDPLASTPIVALEDLADRPWVQFPADHDLREMTDALCLTAGFKPRGAVETSQLETGARLAASGFGAILLPEYFVHDGLDAAVRPLKDPFVRELAAYARSEFSLIAQSFIDEIELRPSRQRLSAMLQDEPSLSPAIATGDPVLSAPFIKAAAGAA
ncbi:LysR family transcriptional regulator [Arthrobacter ramosus]|uniref:LysR family transcriptional regulator n=1 Tax=Arthrobacter ramosus TaxID=1672 RepID=A0ABV5Y4M6_ARTRM|nr:LysR family transcriptional regulator [Arthrobacter ramosus]